MSRDLRPIKFNIAYPPGLFADYTIPLDVGDTMRTTREPENAAAKWSAPSPFYFQKTTQEPLYVGGHLAFGDPPWWAIAYTDLWYSGSDKMRYFVVTFDADLPQGWTDAPCWQVWISELRVFSVALHELGHALDFKSVTDTNTVLYHQYRCYTGLKQRDKNAVDDLY